MAIKGRSNYGKGITLFYGKENKEEKRMHKEWKKGDKFI